MFVEGKSNGQRQGWIEVICGSMFSGKTEELLRRLRRAEFAKQKVVLFKPNIDTRYSETEVVSHDSNSIEAMAVDTSLKVKLLSVNADVVAIDEAQFFDENLPEVCQELANSGVRVILAGLDMDYTGRPFGVMPNLMAIAEDVTKVHAICVNCGGLAQYSHRTSGGNGLVVLGETNHYKPLCRACYNKAVYEQKKALNR